MSKERFKYYYNESVKRYEVFDCYVNLPLSKKGVIKILNDQQDKISDLEAKLAESEERCKKAYRDGLLQKQFDKDMEIDQLKQQLALTEKALELACANLYDINFKLYNTEMNFEDYFKQQAEKEVMKGE